MENVKEKQLKKVTEVWEEIAENIGLENFSIIVKTLEEQLNQKSEEPFNEPFREIEFPYNKRVTPDITLEDINNLKYSEEVNEVNRTFRLHFREDPLGIKGHISVKSKKNDVVIPLSPKKRREFLKKYKNEKSLLCKGCITYNIVLKQFFIFNLDIYKISEPLEKWKKLMSNKKLSERVETLLTILGLNPNILGYHEKLIPIFRLIPLVVRKTFMVELSKKMIGKTYGYESLGFNLYNTGVTRATAFLDGRDKTCGDFFCEAIAFIIDEFHKVEDKEIINALQIYMNGDKYTGAIQISRGEKMESDVSPIILANIKAEINTKEIFPNPKEENKKTISIFENTLFLNSPDGEAFISRINLFLNSWGCRNFKQSMKVEKIDYYNLEVLKAVIPILRDKELDIAKLYEKMEMTWQSPSIRSAEAVEKNFEGLVKLLFPEFLEGISKNETEKHYDELWFLLERAMEMRKTVDNQLKIINLNDNKEQTLPMLRSSLKKVMFNIDKPHIFTAHRIFINNGNGMIEKVALDCMGIELNKMEAEVLRKNGRSWELKETTLLVHSMNDCRYNLSKSGANWRDNSCNFAIQQEPFLNFNYLIGEKELMNANEWNIFQNYCFYDLI